MKEPITKELRELVDATDFKRLMPYDADALRAIADRIDARHEDRMEQSRYETRRAVLRYLRGVLLDYEKGVKRVRKGDAARVLRCRDCQWSRPQDDRYVCSYRPMMAHLVDGNDFCSRGERKEDEDNE